MKIHIIIEENNNKGTGTSLIVSKLDFLESEIIKMQPQIQTRQIKTKNKLKSMAYIEGRTAGDDVELTPGIETKELAV